MKERGREYQQQVADSAIIFGLFERRMDPATRAREVAVVSFDDSPTVAVFSLSPTIRALDLYYPRGTLTAEGVISDVAEAVAGYKVTTEKRGWKYVQHDLRFRTRATFVEVATAGLHVIDDLDMSFESGNSDWINRTLLELSHR